MGFRDRKAVVAAFFATAIVMAPVVSTPFFATPFFATPARAQEKSDFKEEYNNILGSFGFARDHDAIDYTPRAPIVVPPTNDLPAPAQPASVRAGFPVDPDVAARRKALVDPRQPVPLTDSGRASKTRAYLIEPPAAYFDASAVAATGKNLDKGDPAAAPAKHVRKRKAQAAEAAQ